jgi:Arc/MetJ family transcription regulator
MRTTLIVPVELMEQARQALGFTSKTDTVIFALREVVRNRRVEDLKALMGRVTFEFDPAELRERDRRRP